MIEIVAGIEIVEIRLFLLLKIQVFAHMVLTLLL